MKLILWALVIAGLAYGGKYLYDNGYFDDLSQSVNNTVQRTADFATDKAVKEANF